MKRLKLYLKTVFLSLLALFGTNLAHAQDVKLSEDKIDISALRVEAQNILQALPRDEIPQYRTFIDGKVATTSLEPDVITEGVISDYITVVKFMSDRKILTENKRDPMNPPAPRHNHLQGRKASTIIFHDKTEYSFENSSGLGELPLNNKKVIRFQEHCVGECAKILFEGHASQVILVAYHPATRAVMPESVRAFRRAKICNISDDPIHVNQTHSLPAIGLCIETEIPKKIIDMTNSDGLHVYTNMASPFWPDEFEADLIPTSQQSSQSPRAFQTLNHIQAYSSIDHKALGLKVGGGPQAFAIKYEHACVSLTPRLPKRAIERIVDALIEETPIHGAYGNQSLFNIKDGSICHGEKPDRDTKGFFKLWDIVNGRVEFAEIFSPQQIEDNLKASVMVAKAKGDDANTEWAAIIEAIDYLQQYHPGFDNDIAHRIAPILIDVAKYDVTISFLRPFRVLQKMPHQSMAPYLNDLILIAKKTSEDFDCVDMRCPRVRKGLAHVTWKLLEIFNGAGPDAAEFLDSLQLSNEMVGRRHSIGGGKVAASCIGRMGPIMEERIELTAYSFSGRDYNISFDGALSLRMTEQSEYARTHIEDVLKQLREEIKKPANKPNYASTGGIYGSIRKAQVALLNWDNTKPYCPVRGDR